MTKLEWKYNASMLEDSPLIREIRKAFSELLDDSEDTDSKDMKEFFEDPEEEKVVLVLKCNLHMDDIESILWALNLRMTGYARFNNDVIVKMKIKQ